MSDQTFTVVCAYAVGEEARMFYDVTQAKTPSMAIAKVSPKCPETPTDILVFPGRLHDRTGPDT